MSNELKPCPFCGRLVAELVDAYDLEECGNFDTDDCPCKEYTNAGSCGYFTIVCNVNRGGCGSTSGYYTTKENAIRAWNRRYTGD